MHTFSIQVLNAFSLAGYPLLVNVYSCLGKLNVSILQHNRYQKWGELNIGVWSRHSELSSPKIIYALNIFLLF